MTKLYDIAVIGGGIMGCSSALRMAEGGMAVVVLDQADLGHGASGVNAGTLSLQIKRVKLMPYAIQGHREWEAMGDKVGFRKTGSYTLAFTEAEAELLFERQTLKAEAGAPIQFVSNCAVRDFEPNLSKKIFAASYCREDGYADSLLTGQYYGQRLREEGVDIRERCPVVAIDNSNYGFALSTSDERIHCRRLLLAAGAWLKPLAALLGVDLPIAVRTNTVSVTERAPVYLSALVGHATGLLTMKQKTNGTILVGGGWQGKGKPEDGPGGILADSLIPNIALARFALPVLARTRILRSWTGFEANVPDFYPLAGALPGVPNAFVLGCVRGGYTIGPFIGRLMGDYMLGREPELPLFDPAREFSEVSI